MTLRLFKLIITVYTPFIQNKSKYRKNSTQGYKIKKKT